MENSTKQSQSQFVTKKRVNVRCSRPFRVGMTPFSGFCPNIVLAVEDIAKIIENKSMVEEVLTNGQTVPLGFSNYNLYNGPTDVTDNTPTVTNIESQQFVTINRVDANGHKIQERPKRRFGGGFRKTPQPTKAYPNFNPAAIIDTTKDDIVISEKDFPDTGETIPLKTNGSYEEAMANLPQNNITLTEDKEKKTESESIAASTISSILTNTQSIAETKKDVKTNVSNITDTKEYVQQSINTEFSIAKENDSSVSVSTDTDSVKSSILSLNVNVDDKKSSGTTETKNDDNKKSNYFNTNGQSYNKKKK